MFAAEDADEVADFDYLLRVETGSRLVKDYCLRVCDKRLRYADALLVTLRKVADDPFVYVGDAGDFGNLLKMLRAVEGAFSQLLYEIEILLHRHVGIKRGDYGQKADLLAGVDGVVQNVKTVYRDSSGRRGQIARDNV